MGLKDSFEYIGSNLAQAKGETYGGHILGNFVRNNASQEVASVLSEFHNIKVKGSVGNGQWADVPWIAALDQKVTNSMTEGYYVVYLFSADGSYLYLTLAQGVTSIFQEYGKYANQELRSRAMLMESRIQCAFPNFETGTIDLRANTQIAKGYEQSAGVWKRYDIANLPPDSILESDLLTMIEAYSLLFRSGGTESVACFLEEPEIAEEISYVEIKRYAQHFRIERNRVLSKLVKKHQGSVCCACEFDFGQMYGERGEGYIEAHHLVPLSKLEDGQSVELDPLKDFAVLCANCHRMVHRNCQELLSIDDLRAIIADNS